MTESNKYAKTWLYKIVCKDVSVKDCYVGHTTNFTKRKHNHKHHCNNAASKEYNKPAYRFIREHGGFDNWVILIIETCSFRSMKDATDRERDLVQLLEASLNFEVPGRTMKEWTEQNKNKLKENHHQYFEQNKDRIKLRDAAYYQNNKSTIQEKRKERYVCTLCNCSVLTHTSARHDKTQKHLRAIESNTEPQEH